MTGQKVESVDLRELEPFYHVADARLSEGITYVKETGTLLWVDIFKGLIHKLEDFEDLSQKIDTIVITPETYKSEATLKHPSPTCKESVGVIFPIVNGKDEINDVLFASKFGIGRTSFLEKKWEYVALYSDCPQITPEKAMRLRSNDGNVSPCGKYLYVGLMNDFPYKVTDEGCIVRVSLSDRRRVEVVWDKIKIPNAIHWDARGEYTYVTDSLNFTIWKLNNSTHEKVKLIDVKHYNPGVESPEPDGSAINYSSNTLFVAVWSTGKIQEYSLQSGQLLREFLLPNSTPRTSCCAIAGADLYVTTASGKTPNGPETTVDHLGGCLYKLSNVVHPASDRSSKRQPLFEF